MHFSGSYSFLVMTVSPYRTKCVGRLYKEGAVIMAIEQTLFSC